MSRREELEARIRDELERGIKKYRGRLNTNVNRAAICAAIDNVLREFKDEGLLPVTPKLFVLQHRSDASRIMLIDEERWKEMCDVGDDAAWIVVR